MAKLKNRVVVAEPLTVAEQLYGITEQIEFLAEQEKALKAELLENLKKQGVKFLKLNNGVSYSVEHRTALKVKDEVKARVWADANNCLTVDIPKARQILRRELKTPPFFVVEKGAEFLKVTKK